MSAETLLQQLDGVKKTGVGCWIAKCPAHADRRPSLHVRETEDGRVLIHDFGGCGADVILASIGLQMADLFPRRPEFVDYRRSGRPRVPRIPAGDVLRALTDEVTIVSIAACDLIAGIDLNPNDRDRLLLASRRIAAAVELCNGRA